MNKCSGDCVYDYYESDTNYGECLHPDFDPEKPDHCPGYLSKEEAKAKAKYNRSHYIIDSYHSCSKEFKHEI